MRTKVMDTLCELDPTLSVEHADFIMGWFVRQRDGEDGIKKAGDSYQGLGESIVSHAQNYAQTVETLPFAEVIGIFLEKAEIFFCIYHDGYL